MFLKKIIDFLFYGSFFIAACAFALVWETYLLLPAVPTFRLAALVFFATLFLYNADAILPYKFNQQEVLTAKKLWLLRHRTVLAVVVLVSFCGAAFLFFLAHQQVNFWFLLHLGLLSGIYSLPLFPGKEKKKPLRDVPLLKVFLIAYVWASVTVVLPALQAGETVWNENILLLFARRFLFIFALTLLFDIRDHTKDKLTGTRTFPGLIGIRNTKLLSLGALAVFAALVPFGLNPAQQAGLWFSAAAAAVVVLAAREDRPDYFFAGVVDGMMLLQFLVVYLLQ